jgi:YVTN family beta-propeller protein
VTPDGSKVYVSTFVFNYVSVIATATNTVTATIPVAGSPGGIAVTPDGSKVYVAGVSSNNVSVIATASNTVTNTVSVGSFPNVFGLFIGPAPAAPVPTLSGWAMLLLAMGLALLGAKTLTTARS